MTRRILLVEDTEDNREIVRDLMDSVGYELLEAHDGAAGLAMAAEHKPDLILMDIQLPGMDGLEATALIKKNAATCLIPVVALTALAMKGDEARIRAAGCDGYIAKPLDYKNFLAVVSAQLATSPRTGACA